MEKFFHSTFDFFTHALPGILILGSFFLLDDNLDSLDDFVEKANQIRIGGAILILLVGYVMGFACYPIGRFLYKKLGEIAVKRQQFYRPSELANDYVLVREKSPVNFKYIETWNMFCAMSHNLACWALITLILSLYRFIFSNNNYKIYWGAFSVLMVILFAILIYRAYKFSEWAKADMNATCEKIRNKEI